MLAKRDWSGGEITDIAARDQRRSTLKRIGLMQPYVFPYIGYFQLMHAVDEYVIYDDVQFIKGGWINRNNILIAGQKALFTFRLAGSSPNKRLDEIEVRDDFVKFLKTLQMSYAKAPYKDTTLALVDKICSHEDRNLARFTGNSVEEVAGHLGIDVKIRYSSSLREDKDLKGQERVLAICQELAGDMYINAIGGQALYSEDAFAECGIELRFLRSVPVEYPQLTKPFVSNLSIIDLMMFNSSAEITRMLSRYDLICADRGLL